MAGGADTDWLPKKGRQSLIASVRFIDALEDHRQVIINRKFRKMARFRDTTLALLRKAILSHEDGVPLSLSEAKRQLRHMASIPTIGRDARLLCDLGLLTCEKEGNSTILRPAEQLYAWLESEVPEQFLRMAPLLNQWIKACSGAAGAAVVEVAKRPAARSGSDSDSDTYLRVHSRSR